MNEKDRSKMHDLAIEYVEASREKDDRKINQIHTKALSIIAKYRPERHREIVKEFSEMISAYIVASRKI